MHYKCTLHKQVDTYKVYKELGKKEETNLIFKIYFTQDSPYRYKEELSKMSSVHQPDKFRLYAPFCHKKESNLLHFRKEL